MKLRVHRKYRGFQDRSLLEWLRVLEGFLIERNHFDHWHLRLGLEPLNFQELQRLPTSPGERAGRAFGLARFDGPARAAQRPCTIGWRAGGRPPPGPSS